MPNIKTIMDGLSKRKEMHSEFSSCALFVLHWVTNYLFYHDYEREYLIRQNGLPIQQFFRH